MDAAQDLLKKVTNGGFNFDVGNINFAPTYVHAGAIVFLIFILILSLARLRRMYVGWSLKGSGTMLFTGFMLAFILEGFLILGGRTLLTEVLGWKNAPKPLQVAIDSGREKLVNVLGVTEEIPTSRALEPTSAEGVIKSFQSLSPEEVARTRAIICEP